MFITVTVADEADVVFHLEVPDHLVVADFKAMCERKICADCLVEKGKNIPAAEMVLIADIQFLRGSLFDGREGRSVSKSQSVSFFKYYRLYHNFKLKVSG